jgi:hypothetical protein
MRRADLRVALAARGVEGYAGTAEEVRMDPATRFNRSRFGTFLHAPGGRLFRLAAGTAFLTAGLGRRDTAVGKALLAWSVFPLTAGGLDVCYISAALGGPFRGSDCRAQARPT